MELTLIRRFINRDYTIGYFYIDGRYFCDTLEDTRRRLTSASDKVPGKTAIPEGRYKVVLTMSARFKEELPLLIDVPYFSGIRIHAGNDHHDTEGCILLGKNTIKGKVTASRVHVRKLILEMTKSQEVWITIKLQNAHA